MGPDFSGYVTKAGLKCSDGRVITPKAFQHMDGMTVPLVWQHGHNDVTNVLGHAILEAREDGVYGRGYFNDTDKGQDAKKAVRHKDITKMSIFANQLKEHGRQVLHGMIREVSLVLSGANPGAVIDFVSMAHGDINGDDADIAAIIHTGLDFEFEHADGVTDEETIQEIYDTFSEKQKEVCHFMVGAALEAANDVEHSDLEDTPAPVDFESFTDEQKSVVHSMIASAVEAAQSVDVPENPTNTAEDDLAHKEGLSMTGNVFDQNKDKKDEGFTLSHADGMSILEDAKKRGSFKEAAMAWVDANSLAHGITSIDVLFPDAKTIAGTPEFNKRRTEWVMDVLNGTRFTPFSRVKTIVADLTQDAARAKGYIKGEYKKEEWFGVSKRTTTPTTIYKKQRLDRDDILDITDFSVVDWLKGEIRIMLEEECARAILIGDGRDVSDEDKVKDPAAASDAAGVRSILNDHELYVTTLYANVDDASSSYEEVVDVVMDGMEFYKGTGTPVFYTTIKNLNAFKKAKDTTGQRYYKTNGEVAEALGVSKIVTVEPMNEVTDLIGIIVNLEDYNIGTDRGGEITLFDDFDINYNQYLYLMETRFSGALVKIKSALVIKKTTSTNVLASPTTPGFVKSTGVTTIPTKTGVVYKNADTSATLTAGAQTALAPGATLNVLAVPAAGYYFADNASDQWSFTRDSA